MLDIGLHQCALYRPIFNLSHPSIASSLSQIVARPSVIGSSTDMASLLPIEPCIPDNNVIFSCNFLKNFTTRYSRQDALKQSNFWTVDNGEVPVGVGVTKCCHYLKTTFRLLRSGISEVSRYLGTNLLMTFLPPT